MSPEDNFQRSDVLVAHIWASTGMINEKSGRLNHCLSHVGFPEPRTRVNGLVRVEAVSGTQPEMNMGKAILIEHDERSMD